MPDLYGMLAPLLAKMAPQQPLEDPTYSALGNKRPRTVTPGFESPDQWSANAPEPREDTSGIGLPTASTTGYGAPTPTYSALGNQRPRTVTPGGGPADQWSANEPGPRRSRTMVANTIEEKGDTDTLIQALKSTPPDLEAIGGSWHDYQQPSDLIDRPRSFQLPALQRGMGGGDLERGPYMASAPSASDLIRKPFEASDDTGLVRGGNISAVEPGAFGSPGRTEIAPGVFGSPGIKEISPGVWGGGGGAPVGLPTGTPAGAGMPLEMPEKGRGDLHSLMRSLPDLSAIGAGPAKGAAPATAQAGQSVTDILSETRQSLADLMGGGSGESDAGEAYRKEHSRRHVERFPDGTPVTGGTGKAEEHKGFWNRFKHALQGMGLGALSAIGSMDPNDPNPLGRALGGLIGGGVTGGWNPENADRLYNKVLVEPEAERARAKQLVNMKVKMEQEEHSGKIQDRESLARSREATIAQNKAAQELNLRKQEWDEKIESERIKVDRERIAAQEREAGATARARERDWSVPPGHTYKDEKGNIQIAKLTPQQLDQDKGTSTSLTQQWSSYVAANGTPDQRVAKTLKDQPPTPNDIIAFSIQNNMQGGTRPAHGQDLMEILQAAREGSASVTTGEGLRMPYGQGKFASKEQVQEAQKYYQDAEKFFRDSLEKNYIAQDQEARKYIMGQQQAAGGAAPPRQQQGGNRPGTNAKTEGGLIAGHKDKLVR